MLRLFQAGIVAISLQLVAIITITVAAGLASRGGFFPLFPSATNRFTDNPILIFGAPFLTWAYSLIAIGFAFTRGRFVDVTAEHIRRAARAMRPADLTKIIRILFSQFLLCAVGSAIIGLALPPDILVVWGREAGWSSLGPLLWSAACSLGVAGFGATAHAAYRAIP